MCEALGLGGYNKFYAEEQAHVKIQSSTYRELYKPAQFQEGSTEDPLHHGYIKFKKKLNIREIRTTPNNFSISIKFRQMSMKIDLNKKGKHAHRIRTDCSHSVFAYLDIATLSMKNN